MERRISAPRLLALTGGAIVLGSLFLWSRALPRHAVPDPPTPAAIYMPLQAKSDVAPAPVPALGSTSPRPASPTATPTPVEQTVQADEKRQGLDGAPMMGSLRLPILMYHHVGPLPPGADAIRRGLTVSEEAFEAQMGLLSRRGYVSVGLEDLLAALKQGRALPPKSVILTFDDGYQDNYQYALPILKKYGFRGTFFIVTGLVGRPEYLSWEEIRDMARQGMSFGAHGKAHLDLTLLSSVNLLDQARGSKAALEAEVGGPIRFFAYPSGRYNLDVIRILEQEGYLAAVTTRFGDENSLGDLFELRRVRMSGDDTLSTFAAKLGESLP